MTILKHAYKSILSALNPFGRPNNRESLTKGICKEFCPICKAAANESAGGSARSDAVAADSVYNSVALDGAKADRAWLLIAPFGDHPHSAGLQRFDRAAANIMLQEFRAEFGSGLFRRGVPILEGHSDVPAWCQEQVRQGAAVNTRPVGRITKLRITEEGLEGMHVFNSAGQALVSGEGAAYDGTSPYWTYTPLSQNPPVLQPKALLSVALTNTPNIAANRVALNEDTDMKITDAMKALVGLKPEATDEEFEAAFNSAVEERDKLKDTEESAEAEAEQKAADEKAAADAEAKAKEDEGAKEAEQAKALEDAKAEGVKEGAANELVDGAIANGTVTAADKEAVVNELIAAEDMKVALAERTKKNGAYNTDSAAAGSAGAASGAAALPNDSSTRIRLINEGVTALMNEKDIPHKQAWHEFTTDPNNAELMKNPEEGGGIR